VGDPAADSRLAGSLPGIDGLLAVHDAIAPDLHAYACFLLAPGRHAADDGPATALLDALLVAGETAGELVDPAMTRAWLYALTRNECLRLTSRRPAERPDADAEATELGWRHGLAAAEIGAVLGHPARPGADPGPAVPVRAPPGWVRAELVAALGVEEAGRRAELARRAHPYDPEGFPVPVDHRRLSARALTWSAAAVVLIALSLLVILPAGGSSHALPGPALAAAASAPAVADAAVTPLPTLAATSLDAAPATTAAPRPRPGPDRGADRRPAANAPAGAPAAQERTAAGDGDRGWQTTLLVSWQPGSDCAGDWTAELRVRAYGPDQAAITQVTASVTSGAAARTVALAPDGGSWQGELAGLPTGRTVTLTVRATAADGSTIRSVDRQLTHSC
jgi:hypothetical protein